MLKINGTDFDEATVQKMLDSGLIGTAEKNDPASATLTAPALHGPFQGNANQFGIFSYPGARPQRFSALQRPYSLANLLTPQSSEYTNEIIEIMTGQTAGGTSNATGWCGNPPTVGQLKTCQQVYTFGNYLVKTDLNAVPLIGQLRNRADVPGEILNAGPRANPLIPDMMFRLDDTRSQLRYELYRIGVDLERTMETVLVRGTAATDNSRTGWWSEFAGLDSQIKTGYTDAIPPNIACPAADSNVVSFLADITGTAQDGSSRNFYAVLRDTYRAAKIRGQRVGMPDIQWTWVGRAEMFERITDVVACQSANYNCSGSQYAERNQDAERVQMNRIDMLNGRFINIDGEMVPFVASNGLTFEGLGSSTYRDDLYLVPLSWRGIPLLRLEYFPMSNQYAAEFANAFGTQNISFLNNGMFIVGVRSTGLCLEYHFGAKFRMILEAPFLAARIDDIEYSYYLDTRNALPGESLYANGGKTYRL